jgi:ABC-type phosphate/phosphonate transport system substrate-binding protein
VNNTWLKERPELRGELRILWRTPSYAPHPFAAAAKVPAATRLKVQAAFLTLAASEQGRSLLAKVQMPVVIKADYTRDYDPLTRLGLERFVVNGGD